MAAVTQMPPNPMYEGGERFTPVFVPKVPEGGQQASQPQPESEGIATMATGERIREGGCLCGAVRFTLSGQPLRVGLCHCADCRKTSGSAYSFFAVWPRDAYSGFGEVIVHAGRSFCPRCGSRIVHLRSDEAEVPVGTLDDAPSDLAPDYELWTPRRETWLHSLPWSDQFEADRADSRDE